VAARRSDRYQRIRCLGEGGHGEVWLVEDRLRYGSRLALKEIARPAASETLRREFSTLASLRHPNLVEVYEFDHSASGSPRFTLEYVDGHDLVSAARAGGPDLLLDLTAEALRALGFLHDFGLVHRDLKPANLLVRNESRRGCRLVVLDFGLALQRHKDSSAGHAAGTLPYMAPELLDGEGATRASDLYSVGALLHEAVHGSPPVELIGGDVARFVDQVRTGRLDRRPLPPGYPGRFGGWLEQMLALDPASRPPSATEALARLNAACGTQYPMELPTTRAARLRSGSPPGRDSETARIWSSFSPTKHPRVVWLTGGPGTGKTRVLQWIASQAVSKGWLVSKNPFGQTADPQDSSRGHLADVLAGLRSNAERNPTLLVLDEAESADPQTVQLLAAVCRDTRSSPIQLLVALRPAEIGDPVLSNLFRDSTLTSIATRVDLPPMDRKAIAAMANRAERTSTTEPQRVAQLERATEGNPLLLEALLIEGAWDSVIESPTQKTIEESIRARVRALSRPSRCWLEALAVLGSDTSVSTVAEVAGLSAAVSRSASEEAALAELARFSDGRWSTTSKLVTASVLNDLGDSKQLHRSAAELLSSRDGPLVDPGRLARLWKEAGSKERSQDWALVAAKNEEKNDRPSRAADWYRFAILLLDKRDSRREELRLEHAELLSQAGRYRETVRALATVLRLSSNPKERPILLAKQSRAQSMAGRPAIAQKLAEEARSLALAEHQTQAAGLALSALGLALDFQSDYQRAFDTLSRAAEELESSGNVNAQAEALHVSAVAKSNLGEFAAARERYQTALSLARDCGDVELESKVLLGLGGIESRLWNFPEAMRIYGEARRHIEEHKLQRPLGILLSYCSSVAYRIGQYDRAIAFAAELEPLALHLGDRAALRQSKTLKCDALNEVGRPSEAAAEMEPVVSTLKVTPEPALNLVATLMLAETLLACPNPPMRRIGSLIESVVQQSPQKSKARLYARFLELERRIHPDCELPFTAAWREFEESREESSFDLEPMYAARAELARTVAFMEENPTLAAEAAMAAEELAKKNQLPALEARAYSLHSQAHEFLGNTQAAGEALQKGRELLEQAAERIEDQDMRADFLNRPVFRRLRETPAHEPTAGDDRLEAIYRMIHELNTETEPGAILESMLDMAIEVVEAERGMVLLRSRGEEEYSVRVARDLEKETIAEAAEFSRNVVGQAGAGRAVLAVDTGKDERLKDLKSVSMYGIRSVICVPLRSRGHVIGAVYLDNRTQSALFNDEDLRFLEAFADHAALALENAQRRSDLQQENRRLQVAAETRTRFDNIVGRSPGMQKVFDLIARVAETNLPVLIHGESGTGKELVARAIHFNGPRRKRPFLAENCSAIPETLLESELFGHMKGAFTGADRDRQGLFEQAHLGTLFLDEVGDMPHPMQARLLRVLQENELRRVGGDELIQVDVRIVAATHQDLPAEVEAGRFREDLMYRLQVLLIHIPPLRKRHGDIPLLVDHLMQRISKSRGRPAPPIRSAVVDRLELYTWPGNVRQLENIVQRLALLAGDKAITLDVMAADTDLRKTLMADTSGGEPVFSLERNEKERIREALEATEGNRTRAARMLGISRATIFRKIKEHGIS